MKRRKEERGAKRFCSTDDACWIRSSWDLITSILKRAHRGLFGYCRRTVCVCVFSNDKPKSIEQCVRKASGEEHICQLSESLTNRRKRIFVLLTKHFNWSPTNDRLCLSTRRIFNSRLRKTIFVFDNANVKKQKQKQKKRIRHRDEIIRNN